MKKNSFANLLLLSLFSGLLLSIPFIAGHCGTIALVAFLPLLAAEYKATVQGKKYFWICYYSAFLLWNIISTWWIWYATPGGAVGAIVLNSAQMAVIFRLFRFARKKDRGFMPYLLLVFLWCAWEHLYQDWQVTWPWLNLGNSFARSVKHIQWYEITGTTGGSFWILLVNVLLFRTIITAAENRKARWWAAAAFFAAVIPSTVSHIRYGYLLEEINQAENRKEVVILQPNIDPYTDKFEGMTQDRQNGILLHLADSLATPATLLAIAPETFFNPSSQAGSIVENNPNGNKTLDTISAFAKHKNISFVFGAVTHLYYMDTYRQPTKSARQTGVGWLDLFNTAVTVHPNGQKEFYHKSKLVILAETIPYIGNKSVLASLGLDLGGGFGNFGTQPERSVSDLGDGVITGTAICYESVFPNFFTEYIRKGATVMAIITNDGWWKNTSGHIQHLNYARLRAIETRRDIARSANTGISAIINKRGDIVQHTPWWKACGIRGEITPSQEITTFSRLGDVTGLACCWLSLAGLLFCLAKRSQRKH